jgi:hypothetical protein
LIEEVLPPERKRIAKDNNEERKTKKTKTAPSSS